MNCPKCNFIIQKNQKKCLQCGEPIESIKRCIKISNGLYNKGLNLANKGEISNAIKIIEKSILYNKQNIDARNLLGLLYYKIGHFADAMKHWIISTNFEKSKSNLAFEYINKIGNNMREFEKGNDAIRLYNQAIRYLNKKNDDLAIIRLKNSLKILPNFVEALNLLTFCYIVQGKYKKALEIANKTLKIDINNDKALNYIKEINSKKSENEGILDKEYIFNGKINIISEHDQNNYKIKYKNKFINNIFLAIFIIITPILCIYFIYIQNYKYKAKEEINNLTKQLQESKSSYENLQSEIGSINEQLKTENEKLKNKLAEVEKEKSLIENKSKVEEVISLIRAGKRKDAKELFETIDITEFSQEDLKRYEYAKARL